MTTLLRTLVGIQHKGIQLVLQTAKKYVIFFVIFPPHRVFRSVRKISKNMEEKVWAFAVRLINFQLVEIQKNLLLFLPSWNFSRLCSFLLLCVCPFCFLAPDPSKKAILFHKNLIHRYQIQF